MNSYEEATLLFYSEKNFFMSYNLFLDALSTDETNAMFWYGLGDSLCGYSQQKGLDNLYTYGIACVKKSYELGDENTAVRWFRYGRVLSDCVWVLTATNNMFYCPSHEVALRTRPEYTISVGRSCGVAT